MELIEQGIIKPDALKLTIEQQTKKHHEWW